MREKYIVDGMKAVTRKNIKTFLYGGTSEMLRYQKTREKGKIIYVSKDVVSVRFKDGRRYNYHPSELLYLYNGRYRVATPNPEWEEDK